MDVLSDKTKARVHAATPFENAMAMIASLAMTSAAIEGEEEGKDISSSVMELVRQIGFVTLDALEFVNRTKSNSVPTDELVAFFAKIGVHQ